jgi:RNA polymerase sigma-70 factor (family 1)
LDSENLHNGRELLLKIAEGDETAFRKLYEMHWNRVYVTALAIMQSADLAMDVVQDTFTLIWKNREKLASVNNIEAYIYVTGRNRIISILRNKRSYVKADVLNTLPLPEDQLSPERQAALRQFHVQLHKAIQLLPPQQKVVFTLSRLQEHSYDEIAEKLGISRDTVRNHLIKALNSIRSYFSTRNQDILYLLLLYQYFFSKH